MCGPFLFRHPCSQHAGYAACVTKHGPNAHPLAARVLIRGSRYFMERQGRGRYRGNCPALAHPSGADRDDGDVRGPSRHSSTPAVARHITSRQTAAKLFAADSSGEVRARKYANPLRSRKQNMEIFTIGQRTPCGKFQLSDNLHFSIVFQCIVTSQGRIIHCISLTPNSNTE